MKEKKARSEEFVSERQLPEATMAVFLLFLYKSHINIYFNKFLR